MSASELSASPLIQALERILSHWQAKAPTVAQSLRSGLNREQIETQLQTLPFRVPEEVYQLYQWRNGSEDRRASNQVEFMPGYRMLSLEEAIAEYEIVQELLLFEFEEEEVEESKSFWFPLFAEDGNYYVIQGDIASKATAPIFDFFIQVGLELRFNSLIDMMLAIAECFETGAYSIDDYSYLDWDYLRSDQIWFKYQPHRIAKADAILNNAAAILNNQVQHLSDEEQQEAYSALAEMRHPEALPLLIQAVEKLEPEVKHLLFQRHHAPTASEQADAFEALPLKQGNLFSLITGIRKIDTIEAIQYLWHLMKRNDAGIWDAVAVRLASFGISESVESVQETEDIKLADFLFQLAQQQDPALRAAAGRALSVLGDPRARAVFTQLLEEGAYTPL